MDYAGLDAQLYIQLSVAAAQNEVAGYAKDGGKNATVTEGKDKNVMPVSTAEYNRMRLASVAEWHNSHPWDK